MQFIYNIKNSESQYTVEQIQEAIDAFKNSVRFDFIKTLDDKSLISSTLEIYEQFKDRTNFVQVGIGGSSLGPEMLIKAIKRTDKNFYFLNNIDTDHTV
ncbi:glucose-6-phosphate isomerase-like protein, partial [Bacteriovorax sp. DB6_IX]